jgi:hypothetical protein
LPGIRQEFNPSRRERCDSIAPEIVSSNRRAIAIAVGRERRILGLRTFTGRIRLGLWDHTVPSGTDLFYT